MSIFDKHMAKEQRKSMEFAEDSRQDEWTYPSFVAGLFKGKVNWNLIHPFREQSREKREEGDKFLAKLEKFLKENLNPDEVDRSREIPENVIKGLFEMGAFAIKIPKEYGGLGLSHVTYNRVVHLLGSFCGSTAALISAHQSIGVPQPLILFGTDEQKRKYLPRFRKGAISGFALTEALAGSDPRIIKTQATPVEGGKYFLINGEKLWCTNGNIADLLVVMAETPPKIVRGKEKKQITAFIVETNTPGFEVTYRCEFMGLSAIQNGIMRFNNVKVPRENIILGEGKGLKLAFITLNTGRLTLPAAVTGMSKMCLNAARRWAAERKQWGSPIGEHEAIASKLSCMAATVFAMDAVTWLVSYMADDKRFDIRLEAAMAKLFCTEESWKIVNDAVQIRGGRGYETAPSLAGRGKAAYPLERAIRDSRINTLLEGSSEIMHLFIAREALDFHLKKIKALFDPRVSVGGKLKAAVSSALSYSVWYPGLWVPCVLGCGGGLKSPLDKHMMFVKKTSRRLAKMVFHKMLRYQKGLVSKQNILNRFVDISVDLFAMSAACSYADGLSKNDKDKANSVELADLFCREAKNRIREKFREIKHNHDKLSNSVAKKTLSGNYSWLENDIVK
ncbi:MAG: acyl-CoA dehydrogenase family protein [Omnitrophica bacterium]|nr:acyl-CoA dehydrogenase family protein [Candidatus Omnitrophota bacterium]